MSCSIDPCRRAATPTRGRAGSERQPAEDRRDEETADPDQEQVLRADHTGERTREQPTDHGSQDAARSEDREQPLGLTRVHDRSGGPPQADRLRERGERHRHPQHRIDPAHVGQQHAALDHHDRGQQQRRPDVDRDDATRARATVVSANIATSVAPACARYINGSACVPIRSKNRALTPLSPIVIPASVTNIRVATSATVLPLARADAEDAGREPHGAVAYPVGATVDRVGSTNASSGGPFSDTCRRFEVGFDQPACGRRPTG